MFAVRYGTMGEDMEMRGIRGMRETADALTIVLDRGKRASSPVATKEFGSYWDQWVARRMAQTQDPQDLLLKYLMGQGDRPDIGAGINYMGTMGNFSDINPEKREIRQL